MIEFNLFTTTLLNEEEKTKWVNSFIRCFKFSKIDVYNIFEKYLLNDSIFCFLKHNGELIASYSGSVLCTTNNKKIFLSCDTISDGTIKGGSRIAANHLMLAVFKFRRSNHKIGFPYIRLTHLTKRFGLK